MVQTATAATGPALELRGVRRVFRQGEVQLPVLNGIDLVLRSGDPDRYERAAVRWLGRFALEAREVRIDDLRQAAEALAVLPQRATEAMERLQRLCVAHGVG